MLRLRNKPGAGVQAWRFLITCLVSTDGREDSLEGICLIETFKRYQQLASSMTHLFCPHFKLNIIKMGYFETLTVHFYSVSLKAQVISVWISTGRKSSLKLSSWGTTCVAWGRTNNWSLNKKFQAQEGRLLKPWSSPGEGKVTFPTPDLAQACPSSSPTVILISAFTICYRVRIPMLKTQKQEASVHSCYLHI